MLHAEKPQKHAEKNQNIMLKTPDLQKPISNYSIYVKFLEKDKNSYKQTSSCLALGLELGLGDYHITRCVWTSRNITTRYLTQDENVRKIQDSYHRKPCHENSHADVNSRKNVK